MDVFKCVPTGVRDPQTGATCSAGDRIGTVTSDGPSLSVTPLANLDVVVQLTAKTPAQVAQEFNAFQATIETYNIQKQINPNLPQHTENGGGNNTNTGQTKFASVGSTPADPPASEALAQLAGLTTLSLSTDTILPTAIVRASATAPVAGAASSVASSTASDSAAPLPVTTAGPTVTARLALVTGTSSDENVTSSDTLSGTGLPNTVVSFTVDGSPIEDTVTADAQGAWSFEPNGLVDGAHTIVASQTDAYGNVGTASLSFTLDTTTPSGGTPTAVAASDTGSSNSDNITAAAAPTFIVALNPSVVAGDTVQLLLDGAPLAHPVTHVITAADVQKIVTKAAKSKIEAAIKSEMLDAVIEAIEKSANTGKIGDGKIFVFELEQVVRIRTGETGADAL